MGADPGSFGAYGKMPSMGDFFRLHLPPSFVDPWDRWLRASLHAAHRALGNRWQACYMGAPIWRFTLAAGLAGPRAAQGILMPSVDRVGRAFPLTLVRLVPGHIDVTATHQDAADAFAALEELALSTLSGDVSRDALATELASLAWPPARQGAQSQAGQWAALLPDGQCDVAVQGMPDAATFQAFLDPLPPLRSAAAPLDEASP